jgi:chemotaxis protein MotB
LVSRNQAFLLQQELEQKNRELQEKEYQLKAKEAIHITLFNRIQKLEMETQKRDAVIQIQGKVIRLLDDNKKTIQKGLTDQITEKLAEIEKFKGRNKDVHSQRIFFDSGGIKLNKNAKKLLLIIADSVRDNKNQCIIVEGHTDDRPVGEAPKPKFSNNWEISTARAVAVVRFLQEEAGLEPERLSAVGYSYYRPLASNDTEEGRRQNRRVEIILPPPYLD